MASRSSLLPAALFTLLLASSAARGAIIAYEPFDYLPDGADLLSQNGGSGFSGPWRAGGFNASIHNNFDVEHDNLSFAPLQQLGNAIRTPAVNAISGVTRDLAAPLGQTNSTVYLSFLIEPEGTLHGGAFNGFMGLTLESAGEPEFYVGKPGGGSINSWVMEERGGVNQIGSSTATTIGATALLVVKAEFSTVGNDKFTLYVNPTPGDAAPATGVVKNNSSFGVFDGITIYSTGAMRIDEIRIGETFADVTPIPEPSTFALLATATLGVTLAMRHRKRLAR
jgi:hypothetical protein